MSDSPMRCAMTGIEIRNSGDGIWDDGEWISWAYINAQIDLQENGPTPEIEIDPEPDDEEEIQGSDWYVELLNRVHAAMEYPENTLDKISPDWGAIGEDYVAQRFGVKLCKRHTEGHDGRLGDAVIEVKTITPHKRRPFVIVKRSGNFNVLAVVRITEDYQLETRFVRRDRLPAGNGEKRIVISWANACLWGSQFAPGEYLK